MDSIPYYDAHAEEYAAQSLPIDASPLYARFLPGLKPGSEILDLGCGSGRDSLFFQKLGHSVTAVDGSREFCRLAGKLLGKPAECLRFDQLEYEDRFDGVWACASLLHVPKTEIRGILKRVSRAMKTGGVLYMSYKYGTQEWESEGRFFSDHTEEDIPGLLSGSGLVCSEYWISHDLRPGREEEKWLNVLCEKIQRGEEI